MRGKQHLRVHWKLIVGNVIRCSTLHYDFGEVILSILNLH